ncbi:hypothetical protein GQ55_5G420700 [Panicum hallii var. hallii]|uniref:Uncharacterized protein n=1 Tax=Panicum hallii var. hallii TaxID=1504633 RepID=A0A2T7DP41_9POAL|nr:hypothetical protein GQ55_5G420700 [Panicum hallii var. hallii]
MARKMEGVRCCVGSRGATLPPHLPPNTYVILVPSQALAPSFVLSMSVFFILVIPHKRSEPT